MKKNGRKDKNKALFIERFMAFMIDLFLIYLITSFVSYPFINEQKTEELNHESKELVEKFTDNKIDMEDFTLDYVNLYYRVSRNSGITSLIIIFVEVCYYVVYQTYHRGQTIGKRLMKIRVVSDDGDLTMNQMIFRSFLANSLLIDIFIFIFMLFSSKYVFFYSSALLEFLQYLMIFISVVMIAYTQEGCAIHDKLVHTRVIREK